MQVCTPVEAPTAHTLARAPASCLRPPPPLRTLPAWRRLSSREPSQHTKSATGISRDGFLRLAHPSRSSKSNPRQHSSMSSRVWHGRSLGWGGLSARNLGIAPGWRRWRVTSTLCVSEGCPCKSMQSSRRRALSTHETQRAAQAGLGQSGRSKARVRARDLLSLGSGGSKEASPREMQVPFKLSAPTKRRMMVLRRQRHSPAVCEGTGTKQAAVFIGFGYLIRGYTP